MEQRKGGKRYETLAQTNGPYSDCKGIEKSNQSCRQIVVMSRWSIAVKTNKNRTKYKTYFVLFFVITTVLMITLQRLEMSQSGYGTISAFICIIHLGFFENK